MWEYKVLKKHVKNSGNAKKTMGQSEFSFQEDDMGLPQWFGARNSRLWKKLETVNRTASFLRNSRRQPREKLVLSSAGPLGARIGAWEGRTAVHPLISYDLVFQMQWRFKHWSAAADTRAKLNFHLSRLCAYPPVYIFFFFHSLFSPNGGTPSLAWSGISRCSQAPGFFLSFSTPLNKHWSTVCTFPLCFQGY